ncbi:unnamed protein product [Owenia fusiformis]|uniref:G2 and S phase-expressed protein 1 N-terminal domain-containing protein n=1 Tax=Owenia fusiformis TaxID=6347 RepID=A0A8S4NQ59_OWEFU|nr:unnamed protein product [Owenia fusiformis]
MESDCTVDLLVDLNDGVTEDNVEEEPAVKTADELPSIESLFERVKTQPETKDNPEIERAESQKELETSVKVNDDIRLLDEEEFDFELGSPKTSEDDKTTESTKRKDNEEHDDDDDEEEEVFFGPVSHIEKCVSVAVKENVVKPLSPLTTKQMAELFAEANSVASQIILQKSPSPKHTPETEFLTPDFMKENSNEPLLNVDLQFTPKSTPKSATSLTRSNTFTKDRSPFHKLPKSKQKVLPVLDGINKNTTSTKKTLNRQTPVKRRSLPLRNAITKMENLRKGTMSFMEAKPTKSVQQPVATKKKEITRPGGGPVSTIVQPKSSAALKSLAPDPVKSAASGPSRSTDPVPLKSTALGPVKATAPSAMNTTLTDKPRTSGLKLPSSKPQLLRPGQMQQSLMGNRSKLVKPGSGPMKASTGLLKPGQVSKPVGSSVSSIVPPSSSGNGPMKATAPGPMKATAPGPMKAIAPGPMKATAPGPMKATVPVKGLSPKKKPVTRSNTCTPKRMTPPRKVNVIKSTPVMPDKGVQQPKRLLSHSSGSSTASTPPKDQSLNMTVNTPPNKNLFTGGSAQKRRSMLPTPTKRGRLSSMGSIPSPLSVRSNTSSVNSSIGSPVMGRNYGKSSSVSSYTASPKAALFSGIDENSPSCLKPRKTKVAFTPLGGKTEKKSLWSPVKRRQPIDSDEQYHQCTKRIK